MARPTPQSDEKCGLLLVGHGTRDLAGCDQFLATAGRVAARLDNVVLEPCFLELAEPTIDIAVGRLAAAEIDRMWVMPLLLFAAGHAKDDIPQAVRAAAEAKGLLQVFSCDRSIEQLPALGCHPKLLELSELRGAESVGDHMPQDSVLVMVGRGSRDKRATREMFRFADLRGAKVPVGRTEVCFVAMAEPPIDQCLEQVARTDAQQIIVQPHLLFDGQLRSRIGEIVAAASRQHPEKEWIVTGPLGPHALLEDAIIDLVTKKLQGSETGSG